MVGATAAGMTLSASFAPVDRWWAAPLALTAFTVCLAPLRGQRLTGRFGALLGMLFGLGFFLLLLPWVGLYVGAYASWALSAVEALYLAAYGAGAVPILRAGLTPGPSGRRRPAVAAVALAGWWSVWEWVRSSWPWGGFPWGRIAFGQADGPVLALAAWGGVPVMGAAVMVLAASAAMALVIDLDRPGTTVAPRARRRGLGAAGGMVGVVIAATAAAHLTWPPAPAPGRGERDLQVAVVQGNVPRLGLDFAAQRRAVLDNHVRLSLELAAQVDAGRAPHPDLVVWPENASDVPALADRRAAQEVTEVSAALAAPVLFGTIVAVGDGPQAHNSYLVWDGRRGVVDRHDKHYIQPFGEWLPMRGLVERFFPIARSAGHFVPGDGDGVVHAAGTDIAVATCFEVAFDPAARGPVAGGAQLLLVPTNNATFGRSPMTYQQLAMSRVRAVEHRIPVVISATSGVSAVIDRRGRVLQETGIFEPAVLSASIPLGGAGTLSTRLGDTPQALCVLIGLAGLVWAIIRRRGDVTR